MNRFATEHKPKYIRSSSCKRPALSTQQSPSSNTQVLEKSPNKSNNRKNTSSPSPNPNLYVKKIFETISKPPTNHQTSVISSKTIASKARTTKVTQNFDLKPGTFSLKQSIIRKKSPGRENYWDNVRWRNEAKTPCPASDTCVLPSYGSVAFSVAETEFELLRRHHEVLLPWQKLMREFDREEIISN